ncbi:RecQ family ATP-dependent DNA helicase [Reichenbachiella versicolor]|uniref:RecQ family ATP-dependent DNA helicase n=1 Tax=Reichenbachiella versicolor TaxID=1821036 RepID=UPI001FE6C186|nr:RecQ family ATP-dependent DNA helicase [Reichenbachiella versicolor]
MTTIQDILKKYWGYESFRPMQEDIIQSVLDGHDTLALLPTGGGKSICFQVPAMLMDGMCVVISPLIALMSDQVDQLKKRGIRAASLYSGQPHREIDVLLDNCIGGHMKFLYVSPERLKSEIFVERLKQMNVSMIAVDEAHCISQWGFDFRPSYLDINSIYPYIENAKKIALTATATKETKKDICEKLSFQNPNTFQKSFARKNLSYSAFQIENKGPKMLEILRNVKGSAIVYVRSRRETENVSRFLYQNQITCDFYHAGLDSKTRARKQQEWIENRRRVMVATNAFGMGIDKPDVRVVVHLDLPDSLEAYYQEAGRGGRDEKRAFSVLLYSQTDVYNLKKNEERRNPPLEFVQRVYQSIANYLKLAVGSSEFQSFNFELKVFADTYNLNALDTHYAVLKLQEMGLININDNMGRASSAKISTNQNELYKFMIANSNMEPVMKALLRLYGGILYTDFTHIYEFEIAKLCKSNQSDIIQKLKSLHKMDIIIYDQLKTKPQLTYLTPRLEISALKRPYKQAMERRKIIHEKIEAMTRYAENNSICRTRIFQEYFDEVTYINCGTCDVCINAKKKENMHDALDVTKSKILENLKYLPSQLDELKIQIQVNDDFLYSEAIRELIDEEKVLLNGMKVSLS